MSENPSPPTPPAKESRPFIPGWLDDYGLSQAEFRLYCHLSRRADNATGIAWPSYVAMIETCGGSKSTVRRSLDSLAERGLISRVGKPFGGSCRYQVNSSIVPPQGLLTANSSTTGTIESAPIVPPANRNSPSGEPSIVPPEGQEGSPKKVLQRRVSKKRDSSVESIEFAKWFKSTLPENISLKENWQDTFAEAYDELVRIDKRSPEQIREICQWARNDGFWQSNILSPAKLRKRNKEGITYFDMISAKMKPASATQPTGGKPMDLGGRKPNSKSWRAGEYVSQFQPMPLYD